MEPIISTYGDFLPPAMAVLVTLALYLGYRSYRHHRLTEILVRTAHFVGEAQYREATAEDLQWLRDLANSKDSSKLANDSLFRIRCMHGKDVRRGHVWWVAQQLHGVIPWEAQAPACIEGDGLGEHPLSRSLPLVNTREMR